MVEKFYKFLSYLFTVRLATIAKLLMRFRRRSYTVIVLVDFSIGLLLNLLQFIRTNDKEY